MKDNMTYKDYSGSVHYNDEDQVFYGKIEGIRSLVSYEGHDVISLKNAFQESVEDYLETCKSQGIDPEKPFKGSFNVRVGNRLHRKAAEYAASHNKKLNAVTKEALEEFFEARSY